MKYILLIFMLISICNAQQRVRGRDLTTSAKDTIRAIVSDSLAGNTENEITFHASEICFEYFSASYWQVAVNVDDVPHFWITLPHKHQSDKIKITDVIFYLNGDSSSYLAGFNILNNNYGNLDTLYATSEIDTCSGFNESITYSPDVNIPATQPLIFSLVCFVDVVINLYAIKIFYRSID